MSRWVTGKFMHLNSSKVRAKDNYRKSSVIKTLAPWAHVRDSYWREIQNHSSNYVIHKCNNIHKQQRAGKDFPLSRQSWCWTVWTQHIRPYSQCLKSGDPSQWWQVASTLPVWVLTGITIKKCCQKHSYSTALGLQVYQSASVVLLVKLHTNDDRITCCGS